MSNTTVLEPTQTTQLTDRQIDAAITAFRHTFRDNARLASVSDDEIRTRVQEFLQSGRTLQFAPVTPGLKAGAVDCAVSVGVVIVDAILILGWPGPRPSSTVVKNVAADLAKDLAPTLPGWLKLTNALIEAKDFEAQVMALFEIGSTAWNAGMGGTIFASLEANMQWWDWVIGGVAAAATIAALFVTGGAAAVAKLVVDGVDIVFAVQDGLKMKEACSL